MNQSPIPSPDSKSTRRLLLFGAISVFLTAALLWGLLLLQRSGKQTPGRAVQRAKSSKGSPGSTPQQVAAEGFDLLLKQKDPVGAKAVFEECLRRYPDYADAYHGLAVAQREAGDDTAVSLRNHDRAIELAPERADYYWWQSETYKRLKNHAAAIQVLERGLKAGNTTLCRPGLLQVSLAQSYRAQGAFQKALEYNEQALALAPESKWYYRERGWTYQAMGDRERAQADLARGRESPAGAR